MSAVKQSFQRVNVKGCERDTRRGQVPAVYNFITNEVKLSGGTVLCTPNAFAFFVFYPKNEKGNL